MTVITNADGSVAYNEPGGPAFGDPKWSNWWGNRGGEERVEVVDDPANPTGSGKAVRLHWVANDDNDAGEAAKAQLHFGNGYSILYVVMRVVKPVTWPVDEGNAAQPNDMAHKWMYILPDGAFFGATRPCGRVTIPRIVGT